MKVVVVATRSDRHPAAEFIPHLAAEARKALQLHAEGFVREIYSRADGMGAVMVVEASGEEEARLRLGELPLVELGMLDLAVYPVVTYRGIVDAANS